MGYWSDKHTEQTILEARRKNRKKFYSTKVLNNRPEKVNITGACSLCGLDVNPLWYCEKTTNGPVYLCVKCSKKKYIKKVAKAKDSSKTEIKSSINARQAKPSGQLQPEKHQRVSDTYNRKGDVKDYVLDSAKGLCDCCMEIAPFCKDDGSPFLEIHHVHFLSEGGADTIENTVAVCPNCHKELHWGKKRQELKNKLYKKHKRLKKTT